MDGSEGWFVGLSCLSTAEEFRREAQDVSQEERAEERWTGRLPGDALGVNCAVSGEASRPEALLRRPAVESREEEGLRWN